MKYVTLILITVSLFTGCATTPPKATRPLTAEEIEEAKEDALANKIARKTANRVWVRQYFFGRRY